MGSPPALPGHGKRNTARGDQGKICGFLHSKLLGKVVIVIWGRYGVSPHPYPAQPGHGKKNTVRGDQGKIQNLRISKGI
jgi:hypothetical protein